MDPATGVETGRPLARKTWMLNQLPDATKMVLSHAAQAVLEVAQQKNGADAIRQDILDIAAELEAS